MCKHYKVFAILSILPPSAWLMADGCWLLAVGVILHCHERAFLHCLVFFFRISLPVNNDLNTLHPSFCTFSISNSKQDITCVAQKQRQQLNGQGPERIFLL